MHHQISTTTPEETSSWIEGNQVYHTKDLEDWMWRFVECGSYTFLRSWARYIPGVCRGERNLGVRREGHVFPLIVVGVCITSFQPLAHPPLVRLHLIVRHCKNTPDMLLSYVAR